MIFESQRQARGQTRRLLVMFGVAIVLLVLAVNAALALAWGLTWSFWIPGGFSLPRYFVEVNTAVTVLYVFGGWWVETSRLSHGGGGTLARLLGARPAQPSGIEAEQRLCNIVDEMAIASGMHPPAIMVLARKDAINAFAAGWDESDSVVVVTEGALEHLTRDELQGLVAHELSHIREGDTRLNMRLVGMVFGLELLYRLGQDLFEPDERDRRPAPALLGLALMAAGWLGWVAGHALQAAVARQREYLADARALQWTRSRDAIGGVLRKIAIQQDKTTQPRMGSMVQHMLLVGTEAGALAAWFDPHPPLKERIRRIYGRHMPPLPLGRPAEETAPPPPTPAPRAEDAAAWTLQ
nr:M48 family metalloprotease [Ramlibacter aurantiacus]